MPIQQAKVTKAIALVLQLALVVMATSYYYLGMMEACRTFAAAAIVGSIIRNGIFIAVKEIKEHLDTRR